MTLSQQLAATPRGFENIRFFADSPNEDLSPFLSDFRPSPTGHPTYLALSGGGQDGAFGAGVLVGWSESGTRPQFDLVTGISIGALIAPFAFIGSETDGDLQRVFASDIATRLNAKRSFLRGLLGESFMDSAPLRALVTEYMDEDLLRRVAARHRQGARLLVATTNIDAQRSVVWNMGAIAASNHPDAAQLFVDVLVASASIPAIFPPTLISATVDNEQFEEMHVDGGAIRQIFFFPDAFFENPNWRGMTSQRPQIFAIVNNEITPRFDPVEDRAVLVGEAAYRAFVKANIVQSLFQIEDFGKAHGMRFQLMFIDKYLVSDADVPFDGTYMRTLFSLGQRAGQAQSWVNKVPIGTDLLSRPPTN
ncbi:patatin-like phospholipase family protein [Rhodobacteraceae bacterium KMM 6894]|nr:patatin-like phospholipase family protein [Rhodobacteraceae bacterium KMM 6894]